MNLQERDEGIKKPAQIAIHEHHERGTARMAVGGVRGVEWFRYGAGGGEGLNRPVFLSAGEREGLERDLNGLFALIEAC